MIRKINRMFQDYMRVRRLAIGKYIWDRKENKLNIETDNLIKDENVKSILILRYDGKIGDMTVNTLMFREIKKRYPDIKIGVVTRGGAIDIIKNNKNVDKIYEFKKKSSYIKKLAREIADEKYDVLIDFTEMLRVYQMMFINLCKARINIGLSKKDWNMFDISIEPNKDFQWTDHITLRYKAYLNKLGIKENIDLSYDVEVPENIEKEIDDYIEKLPKKELVVINPYGASKHRTFNNETIEKLIEYYQEKNIIFVFSPDKYENIKKYSNYNNVFIYNKMKNIYQSIEFIKKADLVISPDTSIVHIASAFNKKLIAIYSPDKLNFAVWKPTTKNLKVLLCKDKVSKNDEIDINTFDFEELKKIEF
ncbi:glycosyltransferase family 9 protein [Fusobacterium perfoetens]|uniref:glycosyltransferase family 9 protein n=1 Tax=Fusobacterium perfoetens TaxID=852 RepID=UPI00048291A7|nr:glycosyltransferase family 9 protein [Fusobacterium perfoetens]